eukprot:4779868-Pyramimonas_sp.AAC.1
MPRAGLPCSRARTLVRREQSGPALTRKTAQNDSEGVAPPGGDGHFAMVVGRFWQRGGGARAATRRSGRLRF